MDTLLRKNWLKFIFLIFLALFLLFIWEIPRAHATVGSCIDIKGKTTPIVSETLDAGALDFDGTTKGESHVYPTTTWAACAEEQADGSWLIKGWVWNTNLGWVSLYCDGTKKNLGIDCGNYTYGITIDALPASPPAPPPPLIARMHGYAWGDGTGYISFNCAEPGYCGSSDYKTTVDGDPAKLDAQKYAPILDAEKYAWSNNLGWMNMKGMKLPTSRTCNPATQACDDDDDDYCAGVITDPTVCTKPNDCDDSNSAINPGATENVLTCKDGIDNDCDGKIDQADTDCPVDNDNDSFVDCKGGLVPPPCDCDDTKKTVNPGATETCNGIDDNCNGQTDEIFCPQVVIPEDVAVAPPKIIGSYAVPTTTTQFAETGTTFQPISAVSSGIMRETIVRNVERYRTNITKVQMATGQLINFDKNIVDKDFYWAEGTNGKVVISSFTYSGKKTIIIEGGSLFIDGDIIPENTDARLGIIVLKKDFQYPSPQGNIYIGPNVKKIVANMFADGSVFPYSGDKSTIVSDGIPNISNVDFKDFVRQLLIKGSISSKNTIGGSREEKPILGTGEELKDDETNRALAQLYDLAYLRRLLPKINVDAEGVKSVDKPTGYPTPVPFSDPSYIETFKDNYNGRIIKDESGVTQDETHALFIIFQPPPLDLKGFEGAAGVRVTPGGF